MAALHAAVPLEEVDAVAVAVAEHLYFHMARLYQILFDQHAVIAKRGFRFPAAAIQRRFEALAAFDDAHAFTTATGTGFEHHRIADLIGLGTQ